MHALNLLMQPLQHKGKGKTVSIAKKLKALTHAEFFSFGFYMVTGLVLLAYLPATGFPPHIGFLGIASLIAAYSLLTKRVWAPWLVSLLFVVINVFSLYTLFAVGFSDLLVVASMIVYLAFTWISAVYLLLKNSR